MMVSHVAEQSTVSIVEVRCGTCNVAVCLSKKSLCFDLIIILGTVVRVTKAEDVSSVPLSDLEAFQSIVAPATLLEVPVIVVRTTSKSSFSKMCLGNPSPS